jgi:hypothetical protein
MNQHTTLRVGILLFGLYAVFEAVTNGVYYVLMFVSTFEADAGAFVQASAPSVLSHFVLPLAFASLAFGFSGRITRFLIGRSEAAESTSRDLSTPSVFVIGTQLIGLYFVVSHGAGTASHLIEWFISKARDAIPANPMAPGEIAFNVAGLAGGLFLILKARFIERKVTSSTQGR